ncbi:MAG: metal-dependent transcriptional regulator [Spirochaetaceae bacterium]
MSVINGLTDTQERYLETIFRLETEQRVARVKDIAKTLDVKAPTVTNIVKGLAEKGMVDYEPYGIISLTEKGSQAGRDLMLRHRATLDFLHNVLGVPKSTAEKVAGQIEHSLPSAVLCRLVQFNEHYANNVGDKFLWNSACAGLCESRYTVDCIKEPEAEEVGS